MAKKKDPIEDAQSESIARMPTQQRVIDVEAFGVSVVVDKCDNIIRKFRTSTPSENLTLVDFPLDFYKELARLLEAQKK